MDKEFRIMTNAPVGIVSPVLRRLNYRLYEEADIGMFAQEYLHPRGQIISVGAPYEFEIEGYKENFGSDPQFVEDVKLVIIGDPGYVSAGDRSGIYDLEAGQRAELFLRTEMNIIRNTTKARRYSAHLCECAGNRSTGGIILPIEMKTVS
jgi:hypothetical protein